VTIATPLIGIGLGALLAAAGLTLWDGLGHIRGLGRAVRAIAWVTCAAWSVATLFLWIQKPDHPTLVLQLIPMAAVAAPLIDRDRSAWQNAAAMLPTLILAGVGLYAITGPTHPGDGNPDSTLAGLVLSVYVGLAVRVFGEALSAQVDPSTPMSRLFDGLYVLFTMLIGGNALLTLWQRGFLWEGNTELGLAGVWLVWSGAWLSPPRHPRLRAALVAGATLLLTLMALGAM
jgi:hypothetical protein